MQKFKVFIVTPIVCEEVSLAIASRMTIFFGDEGFYKQITNYISEMK